MKAAAKIALAVSAMLGGVTFDHTSRASAPRELTDADRAALARAGEKRARKAAARIAKGDAR